LWTTAANLGARLVTIVSTFVLTRYLAPEVQGEVNAAYVLLLTVGWATSLGVGQYLAAHPKSTRAVAFHGSVLIVGAGAIACLGCVLIRHDFAAWLEPTRIGVEPRSPIPAWYSSLRAPDVADFIPGLALSHFVDRLGWLPRNILVRDMKFSVIGKRVALGEIVFAGSSVALAHYGWGGFAIVGGNLARAGVGLAYLAAVTDWRDYLEPHRLRASIFKDILRYGSPLSVSFVLHVGATNWDNLFMFHRFGEAATGLYNQAYRLADLPANNVGEQINDVLVPTFARLEDKEARRRGLVRAASLMALVVFPMATGLGVVAPTAVETFYPPTYAGVAPFLAVLATLSMTRSIGVLAAGYLQVVGRTRVLVFTDAVLVAALFGMMSLLAPLGATWSAVGVGVAFSLNALQLLWTLRPEGVRVLPVLVAVLRPLCACGVMAAVVLACRALTAGAVGPAWVRLLIEVGAGGAAYVISALVIARTISKDFIDLFLGAIRRRRGG
jgi:PST family polysaccharide transporter